MAETGFRRLLRRHVAMTRRIRALDPRQDSAEFADGRLRDYVERVKELIRVRDQEPEDISLLNQAIAVSQKLLKLKREQFKLPILAGWDDPEDPMDEGGGVPAPVVTGLIALSGGGIGRDQRLVEYHKAPAVSSQRGRNPCRDFCNHGRGPRPGPR